MKRRRGLEEAELNLVPMLDMLVSLIPFLLLTAAFVHFGGVNAALPGMATEETIQNKKSEEMTITFELDKGKIIVTTFRANLERQNNESPASFTTQDLAKMKAYLTQLRSKYPRIKSSLFKASDESKYEEVIQVMNAVKTSQGFEHLTLATEKI